MIEIESVSKTFAGARNKKVTAINDLSLSIDPGEFYVLLGASGCGKTTTLRMIAGLERPDHGVIKVDGKVVYASSPKRWVGPEERPQAMVFQSYALWPNMTIRQNIMFPLRRGVRRVPKRVAVERVEETLELFRLTEQADRKVTLLSGGQQQRVALARGLALRPKIFLMDEPLSNLDASLRMDLRIELKQITQQTGITSLLVTHDQQEAMMLATRIAVLNEGVIEQEGAPEQIYKAPATKYVGTFLDRMNMIDSTVVSIGADGRHTARSVRGGVELTFLGGPGIAVGDEVTLGIRPDEVTFTDLSDSSARLDNSVRCTIVGTDYLGGIYGYRLEGEVGKLLMRSRTVPAEAPASGSLAVSFPEEKIHVLGQD